MIVIAFVVVGLAVLSSLSTDLYYLAVMPRSPQSDTKRLYSVNFGHGGTVYVTEGEAEWEGFFRYYINTVAGIGVILIVLLKILPEQRERTKGEARRPW